MAIKKSVQPIFLYNFLEPPLPSTPGRKTTNQVKMMQVKPLKSLIYTKLLLRKKMLLSKPYIEPLTPGAGSSMKIITSSWPIITYFGLNPLWLCTTKWIELKFRFSKNKPANDPEQVIVSRWFITETTLSQITMSAYHSSCRLVFVDMKCHLPLKCLKISHCVERHMYLRDGKMAFWTKTGPLATGYCHDCSKRCR